MKMKEKIHEHRAKELADADEELDRILSMVAQRNDNTKPGTSNHQIDSLLIKREFEMPSMKSKLLSMDDETLHPTQVSFEKI